MDSILSAISTWKDLIIKVFSEYPLAGALITILAIGAFYHLEKKERRGKTPTNILIVLLGWVILVPLLGLLLNVLGKIWAIGEALFPILMKVFVSFYAIYEKHPFLVIALGLSGLGGYLAWKKWWPKILPNRTVRVLALVATTILAAHIASPVANALIPESTPATASSPPPAIAPAPLGKVPTVVPQAAVSGPISSSPPQTPSSSPPALHASAPAK